MVSIILPGKNRKNHVKEAFFAAAGEAQKFMARLFSGEEASVCECGNPVRYRNNQMQCGQCGRNLDAVSYIRQYGELYIKALIFVNEKRFRLFVNTNLADLQEEENIDDSGTDQTN